MAASSDNKDELDDLLTCTICLETFKNPKYLPCLHTFCETCLQTYIDSSVTKGKDKNGFNCPLCRKLVSCDETIELAETWAKTFPSNHLILSLLDIRTGKTSTKACNPCLVSGDRHPATSWCVVCQEAFCSSCETDHRKFKMSDNHKIIKLDKALGIVDYPIFVQPQNLYDNEESTGLVNCSEHPVEAVRVYCKDHSKPCCTLCATIKHRKCQDVVDVEEVTSGIKDSKQAGHILKYFKTLSSHLNEEINDNRNNETSLKLEAAKISNDMSTMKHNIIEHLNNIEKSFQDELIAKNKQASLRIGDKTTELSCLKCTVDNYIRILETCSKHDSELQFLVELNNVISRKIDLEKEVNVSLQKMKNASLAFEPQQMFKNFKETITEFGKIRQIEQNYASTNFKQAQAKVATKHVNFHTGSVKVINTIDLNDGKEQINKPSGIFMGDNIVLTDYTNYRIVTYSSSCKYLSELKLPTKPTDVTEIDNQTVAVGSLLNTIYIVDIKEMNIKQTINSQAKMWGLQYVAGEFLVAHHDTISWINSSTGTKTEEIKTNGYTWFIHATDSKDYIYPDDYNSVTCKVGDVMKFTYTSQELLCPSGVSTDMHGNIYVCGHISKNIHQITKDGNIVRIISSSDLGIGSPRVIRFLKNSNRFLLTSYNSGKVVICEIN